MVETKKIDDLVYSAVFGSEFEKQDARFEIWKLGKEKNVVCASINDFYMARGRGGLPTDFTVPAMNLRGMTYDLACSIFSVAKKNNVGALIFEIARSEMSYTDQSPLEYTTVVMAAALREGWSGPLFIQGDHFQAKAKEMGVPADGEIDTIKNLIRQAVDAGFYNIDIDMSTLVDLDAETVDAEQAPNIKYSLEFVELVRSLQPKGVEISLGGEIGHIGGKNSTIEDFIAYITGFNAGLPEGMIGMSKISVATGTSHGGVVLADGTLKNLDVDFSVLFEISKACRKNYQVGGAVQHGASTLPDEFFSQFPKSEAIEVHLATGFQNIQMDHQDFPKELLEKMYRWLDENKSSERKDETDEQFHYKLRKKAWGQFKKECWDMDASARESIKKTLSDRAEFLFSQLNVFNTVGMVSELIKPVVVEKTKEDFASWGTKLEDVVGLSD
ncbi:class II fructose-bisphosphate aldolase [Patescibacteria group bacterium]|nr:class II fructose-bisphosphate aldolase [Patescibacteria group bacterium]